MSQPQGTKVTYDHKLIQDWVESRKGKPAKMKDEEIEEPVDELKVKFPNERTRNITLISWEEFFNEFDQEHLAFQFREKTPEGDESKFYKVIYR